MRAGFRLWKGKTWRRTSDTDAMDDTEMFYPFLDHEKVRIMFIAHDYLITHRVLLLYEKTHPSRSKLLVTYDLAEQVEAEGTGRSISTDGLAESVVQATLLRCGLVGANRNRIDDTESESLWMTCQHSESMGS